MNWFSRLTEKRDLERRVSEKTQDIVTAIELADKFSEDFLINESCNALVFLEQAEKLSVKNGIPINDAYRVYKGRFEKIFGKSELPIEYSQFRLRIYAEGVNGYLNNLSEILKKEDPLSKADLTRSDNYIQSAISIDQEIHNGELNAEGEIIDKFISAARHHATKGNIANYSICLERLGEYSERYDIDTTKSVLALSNELRQYEDSKDL